MQQTKESSSSPLHKLLSKRSPPPSDHPLSPSMDTGDLGRVFNYFDEDGDGKISPTELRNCLRATGEELSEEAAEAVVESTDSDGDGLLGFKDFVKLVEVEGEEKGRNLREAFRVYEKEGEGCITPISLHGALRLLGECKTVEECKAMIRPFDLDGDGTISFDEFCVMMH